MKLLSKIIFLNSFMFSRVLYVAFISPKSCFRPSIIIKYIYIYGERVRDIASPDTKDSCNIGNTAGIYLGIKDEKKEKTYRIQSF